MQSILNDRLGNEKYKSKNSWQFRWLEQFDLHLFDGKRLFSVSDPESQFHFF